MLYRRVIKVLFFFSKDTLFPESFQRIASKRNRETILEIRQQLRVQHWSRIICTRTRPAAASFTMTFSTYHIYTLVPECLCLQRKQIPFLCLHDALKDPVWPGHHRLQLCRVQSNPLAVYLSSCKMSKLSPIQIQICQNWTFPAYSSGAAFQQHMPSFLYPNMLVALEQMKYWSVKMIEEMYKLL